MSLPTPSPGDPLRSGVDGRPGHSHSVAPEQGPTGIDVPLGRRVMVVSDLLLRTPSTPSSSAVATELARALDTWEGPGMLIVAGNLFDLTGDLPPAAQASAALDAHPDLRDALWRFAGTDGRRVIRQTGSHEPGFDGDAEVAAAAGSFGIELLGPVDLHLQTAGRVRTVRIEPAEAEPQAGTDASLDIPSVVSAIGPKSWRPQAGRSVADAPWLNGVDRLDDPSALSRFVVSRTLYRRLGRYVWWLLIPFVVATLLRVGVTPWVLGHLGTGIPAKAIRHAHEADLGDQIVLATTVSLLVLIVLAVVVGFLSRRIWAVLGGGTLAVANAEGQANDAARDQGRLLIGRGYAGLVTAATFQPELTHLSDGFYANVGATAEVVEEHRGRLGLPPVFVHTRRVSWVELETGADLHVRLLLARTTVASPDLLERVVARDRRAHRPHPAMVASYPIGESWPPAPDLRLVHRHTRRVRRWASFAILVAGVVDLLDAVTPPLRNRLHLVLEYLPLRASEAAGALIALAGLALLAMGRGVLRGQRRSWRVTVALLSGTIVLHLIAGGDVEESVLAVAILVLLVVNRREFQAAADDASLPSALAALVGGTVGVAALASISIELTSRLGHHHPGVHLSWPTAFWAACERLVGIQTIVVPHRLGRFLSPALLTIGLAAAVVALYLLTRPVVDRRMSSGRTAELRARDIVRRHGASTLDYFALRSDKKWFFYRDSLVAYAVYGGVCLISPDPIGPRNEREQVWGAFRRFADQNGWVVSVMGAGEGWLPIYRDSGMHHVYLGDEAVVDVQRFSLAGGHMKGLRQAHNRIAKNGYQASFHDPSRLDRSLADELSELMKLSRQGEHERGFSMMLGRVFDPRDTGLLLVVIRAPDGTAAAMCQFVPAPGIKGYSLDLMRRDPGDHPNGLLDFALCSTIEHLRDDGLEGLSLNFAALRSTLAGDRGDGIGQRAERWFLKRLSSFAQIESLWKFNAKYEPEWLPRYVVFDAAEHLVPVVMAILRAESLWEIPVLGRLLASGAEKRMLAAKQETDAFVEEAMGPVPPAGPLPSVDGVDGIDGVPDGTSSSPPSRTDGSEQAPDTLAVTPPRGPSTN